MGMMSRFGEFTKLASEFVEYMAKPQGGSKKQPDGSGPLEVSYAPDLDGEPDPGEVVWTYVSYEDDPSQGKDRPVAVIGWDGPVLGVVLRAVEAMSGGAGAERLAALAGRSYH